MFNVILVSPEIPANTGNAIRLCANTGSRLHLVKPLSFRMDDAKLKRAGLDYHEWQPVLVHENLESALGFIGSSLDRCFAFTTKSKNIFSNIVFKPGDVFIFGKETAGLSKEDISMLKDSQLLRLPMLVTQRSLNLSNTVAIVVYEAWRQNNYEGSI